MPPQSRAQRRRQPVRSATSSGTPRRAPVRLAPEPADYTLEYASVRRDLWRILIWTVVLFVVMGVLYMFLG